MLEFHHHLSLQQYIVHILLLKLPAPKQLRSGHDFIQQFMQLSFLSGGLFRGLDLDIAIALHADTGGNELTDDDVLLETD